MDSIEKNMLNAEATAMNVIQCNVPKLETLSDELLLHLFEFMTPRDLRYGFWNLNHRLNRIINSSKICLTMFKMGRSSASDDQTDIELLNFFASRLYSLIIYNIKQIHIDLRQCYQLRSLQMWNLSENEFTAIRSSIMPHVQRLSIRSLNFDRKVLFDRLSTEPFSSLTTLKVRELKCKATANYKPIPYVKSLTGICCIWEDFDKIFSVFPQLRRLSLSLFSYRDNPRWASIRPLKLALNNLILKFSSGMVTPDDDPVFALVIDTRLRRIELDASIAKHNDNQLLVDVLPKVVQRIESVIEQKTTEKFSADNRDDNLETLLETHLARQDIEWCILYMKSGWGYYRH